MKHLLIIGARGFGREVYNLALESEGYGTEFDIKGYLDDKKDALNGFENYPPIIDSVEEYAPQQDDVFICALGDPIHKKKYVEIILEKGGDFLTLKHKNATIDRNTKFGKGCIFCRNSIVSCDIEVGDFVTLQSFACIGHDSKIGNFCQINAGAFMGGASKIGEGVTLHPHSAIHPKVNVCDWAVVGAGAVVIRKVKPNNTVYGNPAQSL